MNFLKTSIKKLLRKCGIEAHRYLPALSEEGRLMSIVSIQNVDLVLDVGANTGQFGRALRAVGYRKRIVSFEPLSEARETLQRQTAGDTEWLIAERAAIGETEGYVDLHVAGNSVSSSLLPMLGAHATAAPESKYVARESVPMRTLDSAAQPYINPDSRIFLKIDTQGYEDRVLRGAAKLLPQTVVLQLELSLTSLYENQLTIDRMLPLLSSMGFDLWNISPAFIDPTNGRLLQIDATFVQRHQNSNEKLNW